MERSKWRVETGAAEPVVDLAVTTTATVAALEKLEAVVAVGGSS